MRMVEQIILVILFNLTSYLVFGGRYLEYLSWNAMGPVLDFSSWIVLSICIGAISMRERVRSSAIILGSLIAIIFEMGREIISPQSPVVGWPEFVDASALGVAIFCTVSAFRCSSLHDLKGSRSIFGTIALLFAAAGLRAVKFYCFDRQFTELSERLHAGFFMLTWCVAALASAQIAGHLLKSSGLMPRARRAAGGGANA